MGLGSIRGGCPDAGMEGWLRAAAQMAGRTRLLVRSKSKARRSEESLETGAPPEQQGAFVRLVQDSGGFRRIRRLPGPRLQRAPAYPPGLVSAAPVNRSGPGDRPPARTGNRTRKPDKMAHRPGRTWGVTMPLQDLVDGDPGDPPVFPPARLAGVPRTTKAGTAGPPLGKTRDHRPAWARSGRALSHLAGAGPDDADPAAGDGGGPPARRGTYRLLAARRPCPAPLGSVPGFAGKTPDPPVREGRAGYVPARLDRIMAGGCAWNVGLSGG